MQRVCPEDSLDLEMVYDPIILSFYESLLRQTDVELLQGTSWLNDSVISFYFEYLEKIYFKDYTNLLFIPPQVTQCIKITSVEEISVFLDPLEVARREFVFLALNDNENASKAGGTHWSLLVYSRPENKLYHFDSSSGANHDQAWELSSKLIRALEVTDKEDFEEVSCLQQTNGYDCGLHLVCNAEHVAQFIIKQGYVNGVPTLLDDVVNGKRKEIVKLIYSLRQQGFVSNEERPLTI